MFCLINAENLADIQIVHNQISYSSYIYIGMPSHFYLQKQNTYNVPK